MRITLSLLVFLVTGFAPAHAQGTSPLALVGKWSISTRHPSGAMIVATVVFQQSLRFKATVTADGKPFAESAGTWTLEDKTLTWRYETSTQPRLAKMVDTDELIAVDATKLVLQSKLSGMRQEWLRVP
jgi:hypothetical protein